MATCADRKQRVFLVDDHALVREWLTSLINQQDDLEVCGEAADSLTGDERDVQRKGDAETCGAAERKERYCHAPSLVSISSGVSPATLPAAGARVRARLGRGPGRRGW